MDEIRGHLVVGDLHGNLKIAEYLFANFRHHKLIFLGDLVDSFVYDVDSQVKLVNLILQQIKEGRAECLLGNHELSYLYPTRMKCTGWNYAMAGHFLSLSEDVLKYFKPFIYYPSNQLLLSHAGLSNQLWDTYNLKFETLEDTLTEWARNFDSPFYYIGYSRWGPRPCGGLVWCDWNAEFKPVPGLKQIFGHTGYVDIHKDLTNGIRKREDSYCIDNLQRECAFLELDVNTGIIRQMTIPSQYI